MTAGPDRGASYPSQLPCWLASASTAPTSCAACPNAEADVTELAKVLGEQGFRKEDVVLMTQTRAPAIYDSCRWPRTLRDGFGRPQDSAFSICSNAQVAHLCTCSLLSCEAIFSAGTAA